MYVCMHVCMYVRICMYIYVYIAYIRDLADWMHYIYSYMLIWAKGCKQLGPLLSIAHDDGVLELLLWRMRSRLPEHQRRWTRSAPVQSADTLDAWAWCQLEWSTSTIEPLSRRRVVDRLDKRQRMNTPRRLCEASGRYVRDGSS